MLDEAFSKSDPVFAQQALSAFRKFGFQLVIVATVQNTTTIQPYIDSVVMVSKPDTPGATPIASTYTVTISEFVDIRQELAATPPSWLMLTLETATADLRDRCEKRWLDWALARTHGLCVDN